MSIKYEVLGDNVVHFPCALPDVDSIIDLLENQVSATAGEWLPWYAERDPDSTQYGELKEVTESRLPLESDPDVKKQAANFVESFYETMNICFKEYFKCIGLPEDTEVVYLQSPGSVRPEHIAIKKYYIGQGLGPHPDSESKDPVAFTASMYLNDDYIGGDLGFSKLGKYVKPTPGSVVIFPSAYLHESTPMVSGVKYVTNILVVLPKSVLNW
jgi:hypothetical protein